MSALRRNVVVLIAAFLGAVLSLLVFGWTSRMGEERLALQFAQLSEARIAIIESEIKMHLSELNAIRRFWENSGEVTEAEFRQFVAPIQVHHLDFRGFAWAPRVLDVDRVGFEESVRGAGNTKFAILEISPTGDFVNAGHREEYFPVLFREPHRDSLGWDLLSEPERANAVRSARKTGTASMTSRVDCIMRPEGPDSVIFFEPVFKTIEEDHEGVPGPSQLLGLVASSMDLGGIMQEVARAVHPAGINFEIRDVTGGTPGILIYFYSPRTSETGGTDGVVAKNGLLVHSKILDMPGRRWSITCMPTPYFLDQHGSHASLVALATGLLLTAFFVVWFYREQSRAARVEDLVRMRTVALRESEGRLELAVHGADLGLWDWNILTGEVVYNERWARMLGYEIREIEPYVSSWENLVHPEDMPHVEEVLQAHLEGRSDLYETEHRMRSKSGDWVWVLDRGRVVERNQEGRPVRAAGTHLEITERKEAEERIEKANRTLQEEHSLFEMGPVVLFKWRNEPGWPVEFVSENVRDITGFDSEEWFSGDVVYSEMIYPDDLDRVGDEVVEFTASGVPAFEHKPYRLVRKDGGIIWVSDFTKVLRNPAGEVTHYLGYLVDITRRKVAEEKKEEAEARVRHAQKLEGLGILAGGIAHDFNNILTGILGNADLALHELEPQAPVRRNVEEIVSAAQHASGLARQMLAYSGKGNFVVESIDINGVVREMVDLLDVASSKKVALRLEFGEDLPPIEGDETQIRQVVLNLVTNASEAVGDGVGTIVLRTGIQFCDREYLMGSYLDEDQGEGTYVFLEVSDNGCGMNEETTSKIFDPFFTTKFTGRGLGMAAVLGIVRGHGGAIKIYSEQGKGSTVRVLFPIVEGDVKATRVIDSRPRLGSWRGSGTILVVDDDAMIRGLAPRMLGRLGFEVITAADGEEALKIFRDRAGEIACVLLDLTMPRMGGEETFAAMRRIRADVPVLLSSGYNEEFVTQEFLGKGLAGFVQKPYVLETLASALKKALGN